MHLCSATSWANVLRFAPGFHRIGKYSKVQKTSLLLALRLFKFLEEIIKAGWGRGIK